MISTLRLGGKLVILFDRCAIASNREIAIFEAWAQSLVPQDFLLDNVVPKDEEAI